MPNIWKLLTPTRVVESVKEVDPSQLKAQGVTAIITDLDNTLVPWRHYEIAPGIVEWLGHLEVEGIKICIASNTIHTERLKQLAETMGIDFVDRVRKPWTDGFERAMQKMGSNEKNTAVFGDQIFTDILCGNRLGLVSILLRPPLSKEEFVSTQVVRVLENIVIRRLRARDLWPGAQAVAEAAADTLEHALETMPDPRKPEVQRRTKALTVLLIAAVLAAIYAVVRRKR